MAPAEVLRYASYYTGVRTLTISGLSTSKKYSLELYASRNATTANNNTVFKIGTASQPINVNNNLGTKALFINLAPNASGQIIVTIDKTATYNYLNGFVLTEGNNTQASASMTPNVAVAEQQTSVTGTVGVVPNPASGNVILTLNNKYAGMVMVQVADAAGSVHKSLRLIKSSPQLRQSLPLSNLLRPNSLLRPPPGRIPSKSLPRTSLPTVMRLRRWC
jgi:hypothetical protein